MFKSLKSLWLAAKSLDCNDDHATAADEEARERALALSSSQRRLELDTNVSKETLAKSKPLAPRHGHLLLHDVDWHVLFANSVEQVFEKGQQIIAAGEVSYTCGYFYDLIID